MGTERRASGRDSQGEEREGHGCVDKKENQSERSVLDRGKNWSRVVSPPTPSFGKKGLL